MDETQENIEESQDIIEEDAQTEPSKIKPKRVMSDLWPPKVNLRQN